MYPERVSALNWNMINEFPQNVKVQTNQMKASVEEYYENFILFYLFDISTVFLKYFTSIKAIIPQRCKGILGLEREWKRLSKQPETLLQKKQVISYLMASDLV